MVYTPSIFGASTLRHSLISKQYQTIQQSDTQIAEVSICSLYEELGSYLAVAGTVWCRARISI